MKNWIISFLTPIGKKEFKIIAKTLVAAKDDGDAVEAAKKELSGEYPEVLTSFWAAEKHHGEIKPE